MNFFLTTLYNSDIKKLEVERRKIVKSENYSDFIENYDTKKSFNVPLPASHIMKTRQYANNVVVL
ncbi:MAG: hypothetical protein ACN6N7_06985 [Chryseobacterium culicis]